MMVVVGSASAFPGVFGGFAGGAQLWAFDTGGDVRSSPALSPDGATLYIGSRDNKVYALRTSTGEQQWAFETGGYVESSPTLSPDGATLYIGSWDNKVYALRTSTGDQQWSFDTGGFVESSPALSPDGATLYIGSGDNKVYALFTGDCPVGTGASAFSSAVLPPFPALHIMRYTRIYVFTYGHTAVCRRFACITSAQLKRSSQKKRGMLTYIHAYIHA